MGSVAAHEHGRMSPVIQRRVSLVTFVAVLCSAVFAPASASAEWFADLYVGLGAPQSNDVRLSTSGTKLRYEDLDFDRSITYGGRFGKYFDAAPWVGLTVDALNFSPNVSQQSAIQTTGVPTRTLLPPVDIGVLALSVDLMLRAPLLATKEIPGGRLQPYVLGGPGIFFTKAEDRGNFIRRRQTDVEIVGGYTAGGGVTWQFSRPLGLFAEYRYSHVNPEFEFQNLGTRATYETDINTHHFLLGLSFKF